MRILTLAAAAGIVALAASAAPATAQVANNDDVRCFLLSNAFAKQATDPKARQISAASLTFYLGRLDGHITPPTMADAMRRAGTGIDPKTAGTAMTACTARMARAEQTVQAAAKLIGPPPAAAPAKK